MNNAQVIMAFFTIAVSFIAVLTGVLLNNARLTDLRAYSEGRLTSLEASLRAEIRASQAETHAAIAELKVLIEKNHSETLMRFADIDNRLTRLEDERKVVQ